MTICGISILSVILIYIFLFSNGIPAIQKIGLKEFLTGTDWRPLNNVFGILPMIVGSIYVTVGALIIGVPIGVLTAIYMARFVVQMVTDSIDAFVHEDENLAHQVIQKDDHVDQQFDTIKRGLISYLGQAEPDGEHAIDLLMVSKYIERIGDHTVNIAKWVLFSITGQLDGEAT